MLQVDVMMKTSETFDCQASTLKEDPSFPTTISHCFASTARAHPREMIQNEPQLQLQPQLCKAYKCLEAETQRRSIDRDAPPSAVVYVKKKDLDT